MSKRFWEKFEEIVERATGRAKSQEMKEIIDVIKIPAEYMKSGFDGVVQILLGHSKRIDEHSKRVEELTRAVVEVKVALGSLAQESWVRS